MHLAAVLFGHNHSVVVLLLQPKSNRIIEMPLELAQTHERKHSHTHFVENSKVAVFQLTWQKRFGFVQKIEKATNSAHNTKSWQKVWS